MDASVCSMRWRFSAHGIIVDKTDSAMKQEHPNIAEFQFRAEISQFTLQQICMIFSKIAVIMFTPARDFLLETPWRIIIPNPNVNSHSLCFDLDNQKRCEPFILCISQA
jgi:hypothetical protein